MGSHASLVAMGVGVASGAVRGAIHPRTYRDSIELMAIAARLELLPGVRRAAALAGSPANREILREAELGFAGAETAAPDDLLVAVLADDEPAAAAALARAAELLVEAGQDGQAAAAGQHPVAPPSLELALARLPGANLALVSTPGPFAAAEALKALKRGLSVFLFSDNVALEDEVALKRLAARRGLLVMGPDCGTAILGGVPLGFANAVRPGSIGLVAASGTGLQQVTCLIDRLGAGVSHAIGVGGRDLSQAVDGASTHRALELLAGDRATEVIVMISKPPAAGVAARVLAASAATGKPVVACFVGWSPAAADAAGRAGAGPGAGRAGAPGGVRSVSTLEEAAIAATALALGGDPAALAATLAVDPPGQPGQPGQGRSRVASNGATWTRRSESRALASGLVAGDEPLPYVERGGELRGLFAGGTFAYEAAFLLEQRLGPVSRVEQGGPDEPRGHAVVDLGADAFTRGRAHPMIDSRLRAEWIAAAGRDPAVGVLLLDVVLGHGAHPDPAGALLPAIAEARARAAAEGRRLAVVASVCGTAADPQGLAEQERRLVEGGALVASSNAAAARLAADLVRGVGA
jgi:FdrA protein